MTHSVLTELIPLEGPDYQTAWEKALDILRAQMRKNEFDAWVKPIRAAGFDGSTFAIKVQSAEARDIVENRLKSRLVQLLSGIYSRDVQVEIDVDRLEPSTPARKSTRHEGGLEGEPGARKMMLQRAYGSERAAVIQPERGMFLTLYFFNNWLPVIGHSAAMIILAARSMCYWNVRTGELRNTIETDMSELARRASVSVRTLKDVLNNEDVRRYFLRYRVRRVMTPNGIRTAGISLNVRMDDPLTPYDQDKFSLAEGERWYGFEFEDDEED